jgi:hypothetical protein
MAGSPRHRKKPSIQTGRDGPANRALTPFIRGRASAGEMAGAAGVYTLLAAFATWPLVLHLRDRAPGADSWGTHRLAFETPVNIWNLWWFRHAIVDLHQSPFWCGTIFYPFGADLWLHTLAPLHGVYGMLLQLVVSLVTAQNLIILASLIAAACCAYALGRALGLEKSGALLAGGIYAFCPPVLAHLYVGHFELMATYWLPAILLVFLRLLEHPRVLTGAALGVLFAASAYSSQYYALYSVELLVVTSIVARRSFGRAVLGPLVVTVLTTLAATLPLLWHVSGLGAAQSSPVDLASFSQHSGDLVGFVVPAFNHAFLASPLHALHERLNAGRLPQETTVFVGWSVLVLAVIAIRGRASSARRVVRLLATTAGVFAVLALGSSLQVLGVDTGVPLPMALVAKLPVFEQARAPGRHVVLVVLALALLAGMAWPTIRQRALRWGLVGVVVCEYAAFPLPLWVPSASPVYRELAGVPGDFGILELPFGVRDGIGLLGDPDSNQVFGQTIHGHPTATGMVSRADPETRRAMLAAPVLGTLLSPVGATEEAHRRDREFGADFFERVGIRAIVVHPQAQGTPQAQYVEEVLKVRNRESFADGSELLWLR